MADTRLLIGRLRDDQLVFPVGDAEFTPLVALHLGNWATPDDGFDQIHAGVMMAIPQDEAVSPALDQHIADASFSPGALRTSDIVPLAHDIDAFNTSADKADHDLNGTINDTPGGLTPQQLGKNEGCPDGTVPNPFAPKLQKVFGLPPCIPVKKP